ncbi:hypothetical protein FRC07_012814 [Ceratobasidium sp. 392]|nr:hypothetical protein FRC07_012814 [Ceratobasidium sp. 392]
MSTPRPSHIALPPNTFGESALESSSNEPTPADSDASDRPHHARVSALTAQAPKHARVSFSRPPGHSESPARYPRRPSRGANSIFGRSSARRADDNDAAGLLMPPGAAGSIHERERPAIPSALNPSSDAAPLPILSMIVLAIVMLGEFLSANVSTPFIVKMVEGFFADPGNNPSDPNNPQENDADVGFSWGFGGVAGAIIGGALESPADKWPAFFANSRFPLLVSYPYLLPCFAASCVTGTGAILCLFLGWDAGPRSGLIRLPDDDKPIHAEPDHTPSHVDVSSPPGPLGGITRKVSKQFSGYFAHRVRENSRNGSPVPLGTSVPGRSASVGVGTGSAYGYRSRLGSVATTVRRRRESIASGTRVPGSEWFTGTSVPRDENIGLAQRLLMANEYQVNQMADLWVAAAVAADNEEVFEDWDSSDVSASEDENNQAGISHASSALSPGSHVSPGAHISPGSHVSPGSHISPGQHSHSQPRRQSSSRRSYTRSPSRPGGQTPLVIIEERPVSAWSQLPVVIIFQYGLLALHNTTHDQIFLSYLVSKYKAGGLGLDPGHFAQLIALMCLAQIVFQFYLYPNIGPPLGRFSHLAMFRIGCALFIPSYLSVVLYRHFASAGSNGGLLIMILLSISTAVRYCGTTFSYTSVAVLLNYMSPPHVVSLSNGMAQSIASLARFIGPVFGGYLWSVSVQDNPNGYGFGFYVCSVVCGLSILHSFTIR